MSEVLCAMCHEVKPRDEMIAISGRWGMCGDCYDDIVQRDVYESPRQENF